MSHLNGETLARLVDEAPDALEAAHLADCDACRGELDALRTDVRALGALGELAPPAHAWDALHARLAAEGLLRTERRHATPALLRLAAALALFLTGTLAGFAWRGTMVPPAVAVSEDAGVPPDATGSATRTAQADDVRARDAQAQAGGVGARGAQAQDATSPASVPATASARAATSVPDAPDAPDVAAPGRRAQAPDRAPGTRAAPQPDGAASGEPRITGPVPGSARFAGLEYAPRNAQEAATLLRDAEGLYLDAVAQYAQYAGGATEADDPLARLVALETIVLTTREALDRAPADPIINGYHMTAVAQREATLRQIAATSRNPWF